MLGFSKPPRALEKEPFDPRALHPPPPTRSLGDDLLADAVTADRVLNRLRGPVPRC
jgi:hypothetical protein